MLMGSSILLSYVVWIAAFVTKAYYRFVYERNAQEIVSWSIIPDITQFALVNLVLFICLILILGILTAWSYGRHGRPVTLIAGVTGQLLVVWAIGFCFCFDGFTGGGCLHHKPEFDLGHFLSAGYGLFPSSLLAILLPLLSEIVPGRNRKKTAEPSDAPRQSQGLRSIQGVGRCDR